MGYNEVKTLIDECLDCLTDGTIKHSVLAMSEMNDYVKSLEDRIEVLEV